MKSDDCNQIQFFSLIFNALLRNNLRLIKCKINFTKWKP